MQNRQLRTAAGLISSDTATTSLNQPCLHQPHIWGQYQPISISHISDLVHITLPLIAELYFHCD